MYFLALCDTLLAFAVVLLFLPRAAGDACLVLPRVAAVSSVSLLDALASWVAAVALWMAWVALVVVVVAAAGLLTAYSVAAATAVVALDHVFSDRVLWDLPIFR